MSPYELLTVVLSVIAVIISVIGLVTAAVSRNDIHEQEQRGILRIHEQERRLSQRQTFLDLWPHISNLEIPAATNPAPAAMVGAVNALELVAVCWESEAVDRDVIRRVFAEPFLRMYAAVDAVTGPMPDGRTGPQMLLDAPSIGDLHDTLRRERQAAGRVGAL